MGVQCSAQRALNDVPNAKLLPQLVDVGKSLLACEGRLSGNNEEVADTGQGRGDFLDILLYPYQPRGELHNLADKLRLRRSTP